MRNAIFTFEQVLKGVRSETGIKNLRNYREEIIDLIGRAEQEINPYTGYLLKKKMVLFVGNGNFENNRIKKPKDFVSLDKIGCCQDGLCEGQYYETAGHIIICDGLERNKITYTYWGLQCDDNGNPITTINHSEAVIAFIVWKLISQRAFMGEASHNVRRDYERIFDTKAMEARGEDFFPSPQQMNNIKNTMLMSKHQMYLLDKCIDTCVSCECLYTIEENNPEEANADVYWWQFNSITTTSVFAPLIDSGFLLEQNTIERSVFEAGNIFNYNQIGRIGFAISSTEANGFTIQNYYGQDITSAVFDAYYNETLNMQIYISKEHYTHSDIFFKLIPN